MKGIIMQFNKELDVRGMNCPVPILRSKKAIGEIESGQILKVLATDSGSVKDMQAFANQTGNKLLASAEESGIYTYFLRKA